MVAIACGCEDADDLDTLRDDPGLSLALDKLPGSGAGLVSQPKMSRCKNAPTPRALARMMAARMMAEMIDISCASYPAALAIGASAHHRRHIEPALQRDGKANFFTIIAPIAATYS